jgi:hypothetical protein
VLPPSTLAPAQYLGTCSAPTASSQHLQHPASTRSAFLYEHLQHLQRLFQYFNCFSQHLVVKYDVLILFFKFYHKVLRKAVKIAEKSLKVPKVLLEKCAVGAG